MVRSKFFARTALGLALAMGVAAGGLSAPVMAKEKKQEAFKPKLSKAFSAAYGPAKAAFDKASNRADVVEARNKVAAAEAAYRSARGKKAQDEARASYEASVAALGALLAPEAALVEAAFGAVVDPDDKYVAGQLALNLGQLAYDKKMQRRGLQTMVDSGKVAPADLPKFNYFIGAISYDLKEYPAARTSLQAAIAGGYTESGVEGLLADAYIYDNLPVEGLKVLDEALTKRGAAAPEDWIKKGIVVAYRSKLPEQSVAFSVRLVQLYPTKDNWALAIAVVRDMSKFQNQETLDLMRLMGRTESWSEARDYIEYIQAADPRRLPNEAMKIINLGLASGKLESNDPAVADWKSIASGRIAPDKASLPALERDARAANSTAATAMAAGDAFLSYDDAAKAEEMYKIALTKPGVDEPRVLTRLGIAQADLGKSAEAQETLGKVTGIRSPIAQMWAAYARSKAAPAN